MIDQNTIKNISENLSELEKRKGFLEYEQYLVEQYGISFGAADIIATAARTNGVTSLDYRVGADGTPTIHGMNADGAELYSMSFADEVAEHENIAAGNSADQTAEFEDVSDFDFGAQDPNADLDASDFQMGSEPAIEQNAPNFTIVDEVQPDSVAPVTDLSVVTKEPEQENTQENKQENKQERVVFSPEEDEYLASLKDVGGDANYIDEKNLGDTEPKLDEDYAEFIDVTPTVDAEAPKPAPAPKNAPQLASHNHGVELMAGNNLDGIKEFILANGAKVDGSPDGYKASYLGVNNPCDLLLYGADGSEVKFTADKAIKLVDGKLFLCNKPEGFNFARMNTEVAAKPEPEEKASPDSPDGASDEKDKKKDKDKESTNQNGGGSFPNIFKGFGSAIYGAGSFLARQMKPASPDIRFVKEKISTQIFDTNAAFDSYSAINDKISGMKRDGSFLSMKKEDRIDLIKKWDAAQGNFKKALTGLNESLDSISASKKWSIIGDNQALSKGIDGLQSKLKSSSLKLDGQDLKLAEVSKKVMENIRKVIDSIVSKISLGRS